MSRRLLSNAALLLAFMTGMTPAAENPGRNNSTPMTTLPAGNGREEPAASSSDQRPDGNKDASPVRRAERNPRVLFITEQDSETCKIELARLRKPGGDFEGMQQRGWKIGETPDCHLQIIDKNAVPDLVRQLNVREFPTVACIHENEIVRSFKAGCTTPLDAWTFGWLLKGQNERPQPAIPEPVRVATTGHYPLRGNHWSIEGDWNPTHDKLVSHLRSPNHAPQLAAHWQIESWSHEELRSLHDDLHEREGGGASYTSAASASSAPRGLDQFRAGRKF